MKKVVFVILMVVSTTACFGQSLFFDNLNNSTWKSEPNYNDLTIRTSREIGLAKVKYSIDSLKVNVTIWTFKDSVLAVSYYNSQLKKDSLVATYKYKPHADRGALSIILEDNKTLEYEVGIVSTGSYASLTRKNMAKPK